MKTFQSNSAENFSWRDLVNARLPGKMAGASSKLLVLLHTGMRALETPLFPECYGRLATEGDVPGLPGQEWGCVLGC